MSAQGWAETPISLNTDGPALASSTTPTSLIGPSTNVASAAKLVIPANFFQIGKVIRLTACGRISNIVTTPGNFTLDLRFGATVVWNGGAVALNTTAKTNVAWMLQAMLTARVVGGGTLTTLMGQGKFISESVIGSAAGVANTALVPASAPAVGTGFDCTAAQLVDLFGTFSISNAGNSCTLHQYMLEAMN